MSDLQDQQDVDAPARPERTGTLADLRDMAVANAVTAAAAPVHVEPKRDALGRSYATGRRKNAIARVWIKPGRGGHQRQRQDGDSLFSPAPCCAC